MAMIDLAGSALSGVLIGILIICWKEVRIKARRELAEMRSGGWHSNFVSSAEEIVIWVDRQGTGCAKTFYRTPGDETATYKYDYAAMVWRRLERTEGEEC